MKTCLSIKYFTKNFKWIVKISCLNKVIFDQTNHQNFMLKFVCTFTPMTWLKVTLRVGLVWSVADPRIKVLSPKTLQHIREKVNFAKQNCVIYVYLYCILCVCLYVNILDPQHTREREKLSTWGGKTLPKQSKMRCPPVPVYMTANSPQTRLRERPFGKNGQFQASPPPASSNLCD